MQIFKAIYQECLVEFLALTLIFTAPHVLELGK